MPEVTVDPVTFVRARLDEDAADNTPSTVVVSGGYPAPEVPNCIGPDGRGGCRAHWKLDHPAGAEPRWWDNSETRALMAAHSMIHATPAQRRALHEVGVKRRILDLATNPPYGTGDPDGAEWGWSDLGERVVRLMAGVWPDHPDYDAAWASS